MGKKTFSRRSALKHQRTQTRFQFFILICVISISSLCKADVAVLVGPTVVGAEDALSGFASVCSEKKVEFHLTQDLSNESQVIDQIKKGTFSLVLALGPHAVEIASSDLSELPVVFSQVTDINNVKTDAKNLTGVLQSALIEEHLRLLRSLDKDIRKLGVIYTQPYNDEFIRQAEKAASKEGLTLVLAPISKAEDVPGAMKGIMEQSDALWIPLDPSLVSEETIRYVGATCLERKTLCMGATDRNVRFGSVFALVMEAVDAGRSAGELANKILNGTKPSKIDIIEMKTPQVIVNLKVIKLLGLTLPKSMENAASKVYQ